MSNNSVYLEDIQSTGGSRHPTSSPGPSSANDNAQATTQTTKAVTVKRQRTLADMFNPAPAPKKAKVGTPSGSKPSPMPVKANASLNSIPFSMSAYKGDLSEEELKLLTLECDTMGKSWLKLLKDEIRKPYFLSLKRFLWQQGVTGVGVTEKLIVYPSPENIYSWSSTALGRVRVVILGQDPYHQIRGQAHGLCFSVPKGVAVPPSLRNIYAELRAEYPDFEAPKHGNLTSWAENGVLLLNTALTVKANEAGSHSGKGWETFTGAVVDVVDKYGGANLSPDNGGLGQGVVFLAWGAWAAKRVAHLDKKKHLILTSAHPSPLSAHRGFLGNGHFKKANDWLEAKYGAEGCVDWCTL